MRFRRCRTNGHGAKHGLEHATNTLCRPAYFVTIFGGAGIQTPRSKSGEGAGFGAGRGGLHSLTRKCFRIAYAGSLQHALPHPRSGMVF